MNTSPVRRKSKQKQADVTLTSDNRLLQVQIGEIGSERVLAHNCDLHLGRRPSHIQTRARLMGGERDERRERERESERDWMIYGHGA